MMRGRLLSFCAALWGLAIAIALLPHWTRPAPPGQLPGFATSSGFDAHAPFYFIASVIVLPIMAAFLMRPLIDRALLTMSVWIVVVAISYAERHHLH